MTHFYLCGVAYQWLRDYRNCSVVSKELGAGEMHEIPDAIGFKSSNSILVECKTSRSDFLADKKKFVRKNEQWAMGRERWFLVPKGLIKREEVPDGWGLLYCCKSRHQRGFYIKEVKKAKKRVLGRPGLRMENQLLVSIAWRASEALRLLNKVGFGSKLFVEDEHGCMHESE